MKLAVDAREAFAAQKAGKGQWTYGFLAELRTRGHEVIMLTDSPVQGATVLPKGIKWHMAAATFVEENDIDAYISPTSFITPFFIGSKVPYVPIVHDMIAFRGETHNLKATIIERLFLPIILKKALHVFTVSDTTKRDLLEKFPSLSNENVTSVYAGPMKQDVPLAKPDGKTILCVGTLCPRKNQKRLITAYASLPDALRKQFKLVLVGGRGWNDECTICYAQNTKGVEWLDYVSDEEYQSLLSTATVFAYPSLYEGFGMQVLDALQRGLPILTSNRGSLAEVVGEAALVVDPESDRSIASGLIALLEHEDVRDALSTKGPEQAKRFSWKQTVDIFLEQLQKALY